MRKTLLSVMTAITALLVLAAAGAQVLVGEEAGCEIEAPFTCEGFSATGNALAVDLAGPEAEDVRVIVTGGDCEADSAFFTSFDGQGQATFSCSDLRPGDKAFVSILYDAEGQRNALSGQIVLG